MKNNPTPSGFEFSELFAVYMDHFLFPLHVVLLALLVAYFADSLYIYFHQHRERLAEEPTMAEHYVAALNRGYHFLAELFLLSGLAGAALVIQGIFTGDWLSQISAGESVDLSNIEEIRQGITFSAVGVIGAIGCYLLRQFLLFFYQSHLAEAFASRARAQTAHAGELQKLHGLLEQFISRQNDPFVPLEKVIAEIKALNKTLNSDVIQKNMAAELGELIERQGQQAEEHLGMMASTVDTASDMLRASGQTLDRWLEHSQGFMGNFEKLQREFNRTGNEVAERLERLSAYLDKGHEPFIERMKSIHAVLEETKDTVIADFKTSHETLRQQFVGQIRAAVHLHEKYVEDNSRTVESAVDKVVAGFHENTKQEHEHYLAKMDGYYTLFETAEKAFDVRAREAASLFQQQIDSAFEYYQKLVDEHGELVDKHGEENEKIRNELKKSVADLQAMILSDFSEKLTTTTTGICNALDEFAKAMAGTEDAAAAKRESMEIKRIQKERTAHEYARHNVNPNKTIWNKASDFVRKIKERKSNH
uniref:Uncharacterized protein n=1 Tax=Candidatus Kentrum sp. FM TaxID=2126340 RepID=A0A450RY64_9GAMM|nr:MAG: hypothetical protein BECKFM1743C_GA0114222_1000811 [Candidatus Kentron sp. FM]VFJ46369.1 MAG: hypothetical protein BECKFM1743A_GA0114220_100367 [Candidatus Kentron sp. FM]VFK07503.1 MAG: hypothetical protein BECKFM1743B_GA0114221_100425 [Candidatus Kentron sp. FM]